MFDFRLLVSYLVTQFVKLLCKFIYPSVATVDAFPILSPPYGRYYVFVGDVVG